jgi:hypothetical protein
VDAREAAFERKAGAYSPLAPLRELRIPAVGTALPLVPRADFAQPSGRAKLRLMRVRGSNRPASIQSWLGSAVLMLLACGAESQQGSAAEEPEAPGTTASTSGVPAGGAASNSFTDCPTPIGTTDELARTPRDDTNLELLALSLDTGQLTATQATYERVVADIGVIRGLAPSLSTLAFWPAHDGSSLRITFGEDATDALSDGTYTAWDCLLEAYRAEIGSVTDIVPTYAPTLYLGGIFDMPRLAQLFEQLPDVTVDINATPGRRTLCATRDGEHYDYVVDRTNLGCDSPPPCTGSARHFSSDAPGEVSVLESWTADDDAAAPDWFRNVCL